MFRRNTTEAPMTTPGGGEMEQLVASRMIGMQPEGDSGDR